MFWPFLSPWKKEGVCVCVCVCVRERGREKGENITHLPLSCLLPLWREFFTPHRALTDQKKEAVQPKPNQNPAHTHTHTHTLSHAITLRWLYQCLINCTLACKDFSPILCAPHTVVPCALPTQCLPSPPVGKARGSSPLTRGREAGMRAASLCLQVSSS